MVLGIIIFLSRFHPLPVSYIPRQISLIEIEIEVIRALLTADKISPCLLFPVQ